MVGWLRIGVTLGALLAGTPGWSQPERAKSKPEQNRKVAEARSTDACDVAVDPAAVARLAEAVRQALRDAPPDGTQAALETRVEDVIVASGVSPRVADAALESVLAMRLAPVERAAVEEVRKRVGAVLQACGPGAGGVGAAALAPPPNGQGGGGTDYAPPNPS